MKKVKFKREYFAMPYALLCVIFVVVPLIILLVYALRDSEGKFSFDNFIYFFSQKGHLRVMLDSLGMAFLTTLICLVLAYPLAWMLANSHINKSAILVMLFVIPMWINSLLRIYALKTVFSLIKLKSGYLAVLLGMVYDFFPFMLLPIYTILNNLDNSLDEAATDLGATPFKRFVCVTLPLSIPGVISGMLMVFMPTISTFAVTDMLGNADLFMFGNLIDAYFGEFETWNVGAAFAFIMLILIAVSMFIANKLTKGESNKRSLL